MKPTSRWNYYLQLKGRPAQRHILTIFLQSKRNNETEMTRSRSSSCIYKIKRTNRKHGLKVEMWDTRTHRGSMMMSQVDFRSLSNRSNQNYTSLSWNSKTVLFVYGTQKFSCIFWKSWLIQRAFFSGGGGGGGLGENVPFPPVVIPVYP